MAKKSKVKIREIAPKMKIIEEKKEQEAEENDETPLEEMTAMPSMPSRGASMPFVSEVRIVEQHAQEVETPTPSGTTEAESRAQVRYGIQRDVSEREIRRVYNERRSSQEASLQGQRALAPPLQNLPRQIGPKTLRNDEIGRTAGMEEAPEDKYEVNLEKESKGVRRKYPWEA